MARRPSCASACPPEFLAVYRDPAAVAKINAKNGSYGCPPETRSGLVPVRPELVAEIRYFGRYRGGWIRDGVMLSVG